MRHYIVLIVHGDFYDFRKFEMFHNKLDAEKYIEEYKKHINNTDKFFLYKREVNDE